MLKTPLNQPEFIDFYLPFGGKLQASNRWVKLSEMIPWDVVEACYAESLAGTGQGSPAKSGRKAYGALLIKERLWVSDEEVVEQVIENPYLQYFLGLHEYQEKAPFDPSMMVHFRSRFSEVHHQKINDHIIQQATLPQKDEDDDNQDPPLNSGKLLIDATCTPADIKYPTDLGLLNEAREKTEAIIDQLHAQNLLSKSDEAPKVKKVRTYRQKARQQYLAVAKQKKATYRTVQTAIRQQLGYVRRNLKHIAKMVDQNRSILSCLDAYWYKSLLVIDTLYAQQHEMFKERKHQVPNRIVSISQPHVRPIVRGKAGKKVEFGAKISASFQQDGYITLDHLSWEAFNESGDLISQVEAYHKRFGYYPQSVHADTIYQNRTNRNYCKEKGIRLTGRPLGRPKKVTEENRDELRANKQQRRQDELDRIPIEGKFGNAKRKGTLQRIMAKLSKTSESVIHVGIVMLNLEKWLKELLFCLIRSVKMSNDESLFVYRKVSTRLTKLFFVSLVAN